MVEYLIQLPNTFAAHFTATRLITADTATRACLKTGKQIGVDTETTH